MALKKLELQVPEELLEALGDQERAEKKVLEALLLSLIQQGEVTASYAAEVLGISYYEMLDLMAKHNIPLINYDPDEVDEGLAALEKYPQ